MSILERTHGHRDAPNVLKKIKESYHKHYVIKKDNIPQSVFDLEAQIAQNRNAKENLIRENLELSKTVELTKINRRNAELEIQRTIEMVAKKLNDSSIAVPPPPPPPVAAK